MPRNFGHPSRDENRDPNWIFYAIGVAVVLMIAIGLFVS
jgi:hypothetical protein